MSPIYSTRQQQTPPATPEFRLMLACVRSSSGKAAEDDIAAALTPDIDWKNFLKTVDWHRVTPPVYTALSKRPDIPEHVQVILRRRFRRNGRRGLEHAAEVARLSRLCAKHEIPVLLLKGVAFALQLYGDLAQRHHGDIDLLVPPDRIADMDDMLCRAGYQRESPGAQVTLTPTVLRALQRHSDHCKYVHPDTKILVEVHWHLHTIARTFPLSFEELEAQARTISIGGTPISTPSAAMTTLFACAHGAVHAWHRLAWLRDLATLLQHAHELEWSDLLHEAEPLGVTRTVAQGAELAHLLLQSPIPEELAAYSRRDRVVPGLVRQALAQMAEEHFYWQTVRSHIRHIFYLPKLCADWRYKIQTLRCPLFSPKDLAMLQLPNPLLPAYYVLRPFLWLWRQR